MRAATAARPPLPDRGAASGLPGRARALNVASVVVAPSSHLLALELPEEALLMGIAREGSLGDADLDVLEATLLDPEVDPHEAAGAALALGRAGRRTSAEALSALAAAHRAAGRIALAEAARLALELLELPPPGWIERAESGYRRTDPDDGSVLYVEDPLAAYWHRRDRWGPPIRPRVEEPDVVAESDAGEDLAGWVDAAEEGRLVAVRVAGEPSGRWLRDRLPALRRPEGRLYLTRAGWARTRSLEDLVRWSRLRSLGFVGRGRRRRVAYEVGEEAAVALPAPLDLAPGTLHALCAELAERARPDRGGVKGRSEA